MVGIVRDRAVFVECWGEIIGAGVGGGAFVEDIKVAGAIAESGVGEAFVVPGRQWLALSY